MVKPLGQLKRIRLEKLEKIRKLGVNAYPSKYEGRVVIAAARGKKLKSIVRVGGRLMSWRSHGKLVFADLRDESGQIQLCFRVDQLSTVACQLLHLLDIGDFLGAEGKLFKTKTGELTIEISTFTLLSKALRPLPAKWDGLKDVERRYRQRYLDLIMNPEVKGRFEKISQIVAAMRKYLVNDDYIEVLTPSLQPLYGGTLARPFETFFNALDAKMYLRISNEMYLKRLIAGGYEKVFEFSVDFRNEGIDTKHNPEFLQMETMWAYADYEDNMKLVEEMFAFIAKKVLGTAKIKYQGCKINLTPPWTRLRMVEAVEKYGGIAFDKVKEKSEAIKIARKLGIPTKEDMGVGKILEEVFDKVVQPHLIQPTLVHDYHIETSPLAKPVPGNPNFTERFEIFIGGREFGNSYSEANDPGLLRQNFRIQQEMRAKGDLEAHPVDEDFLEAMEYGMPPTSGLGVGMERLFMLLTDCTSIREVMFFPALRPEKPPPSEGKKYCYNNTYHYSGRVKELFQVDDEAKKKFGGIKIGLAVIEGVSVKKEAKELEVYKEEVLLKLKELTTEEISKIPSVKAYRRLFKAFGVDWHSRRPSVEALLRRVATGKGLYKVNTLVDTYNLAVLESKVSLGAFDLDRLSLPKVLRLAKEGEEIVLLGESQPTVIREGELIYADRKGPVTLDVNYRDCDRTKITAATKNILLIADGCEEISSDEVVRSLERGVEFITRFCGGKLVEKFIID